MDINIPEIVAEVTAAFMRYEKALSTNDIDTQVEDLCLALAGAFYGGGRGRLAA